MNLTRFSIMFPEKREFFLEGQGIFDFAAARFGGPPSARSAAPSRALLQPADRARGGASGSHPFGGARYTGKMGKFSVGPLNIQTDDSDVANADSTNFSVVRVKRDFLRGAASG